MNSLSSVWRHHDVARRAGNRLLTDSFRHPCSLPSCAPATWCHHAPAAAREHRATARGRDGTAPHTHAAKGAPPARAGATTRPRLILNCASPAYRRYAAPPRRRPSLWTVDMAIYLKAQSRWRTTSRAHPSMTHCMKEGLGTGKEDERNKHLRAGGALGRGLHPTTLHATPSIPNGMALHRPVALPLGGQRLTRKMARHGTPTWRPTPAAMHTYTSLFCTGAFSRYRAGRAKGRRLPATHICYLPPPQACICFGDWRCETATSLAGAWRAPTAWGGPSGRPRRRSVAYEACALFRRARIPSAAFTHETGWAGAPLQPGTPGHYKRWAAADMPARASDFLHRDSSHCWRAGRRDTGPASPWRRLHRPPPTTST